MKSQRVHGFAAWVWLPIVYAVLLMGFGPCVTLPTPPDAKPELDSISQGTAAVTEAASTIRKEIGTVAPLNAAGKKDEVAKYLKNMDSEAQKALNAAKAIEVSKEVLITKSAEAGVAVEELKTTVCDLQDKLAEQLTKYATDMQTAKKAFEAESKKTAAENAVQVKKLQDLAAANTKKLAEQDKEILKLQDQRTTWILTFLVITGSLLIAGSAALAIYVKPALGAAAAIVGFSMLGTGWLLQTYMKIITNVFLGLFILIIVSAVASLIWIIVKKQNSLKEIVSGNEAAKLQIDDVIKEKMSLAMSKVQSLSTEAEVTKIKKAMGLDKGTPTPAPSR